jgi:hypothetical protein
LLPGLSLQIVVDNADTAMPVLLKWMGEKEIGIQRASEYNPPFDDVFVMLVQRETGQEVGGNAGESENGGERRDA